MCSLMSWIFILFWSILKLNHIIWLEMTDHLMMSTPWSHQFLRLVALQEMVPTQISTKQVSRIDSTPRCFWRFDSRFLLLQSCWIMLPSCVKHGKPEHPPFSHGFSQLIFVCFVLGFPTHLTEALYKGYIMNFSSSGWEKHLDYPMYFPMENPMENPIGMTHPEAFRSSCPCQRLALWPTLRRSG